MREQAAFPSIRLNDAQRKLTERANLDVAMQFRWKIHAVAAQSDHVHVVVTAAKDPEELREAIKAAASRALNEKYGGRPWWAVGGSCKYLWKRDYFESSVKYVRDQRD